MAESLAAYRQSLKYFCTISLAKYSRPEPFDNPAFNADKIIRLPLPMELSDNTAVDYSSTGLKLVGDLMNGDAASGLGAEVLRQSGNMAEGLISMAGGAISRAAGTGIGGQLVGKLAGGIQQALPAEAITSAVQQAAGLAPNPNPSVAFQGPLLRDISFTWTFMPTNETDSKKIRQIINYLKMRALPANKVARSAAILEYPYIAQLNFYPWDYGGGGDWGWNPNTSIIRIKRCFMGAVNVNYNNAGLSPAFFKGDNNEPVVIQLTINFKEIEYLLSNDWGGLEGTGEGLGIGDDILNIFSFGNDTPANVTDEASGT